MTNWERGEKGRQCGDRWKGEGETAPRRENAVWANKYKRKMVASDKDTCKRQVDKNKSRGGGRQIGREAER